MIEFCKVNKSFRGDFWKKKKEVLKNLSFKVEPGSLCGFLGANGAGKTTSIKGLLGFISFDSGAVNFDSSMGEDSNSIKSNIGYFPERPYFYPGMSGNDFCFYMGGLQGLSGDDLKSQIHIWSERLNIAHALDQKIRSYSKGMLQRLGFVTCLIHRPRFVVLDEPLSGLDPLGRKEFKDILRELNNDGVTIFFSSHIVADVEEISDSLVVIKDGTTFFSGNKSELIGSQTGKSVRVAFRSDSSSRVLEKYDSCKVLNREGDLTRVLIPFQQKDQFLEGLFTANCSIEDLQVERQTLEEIIYNSRGES